MPDISELNGTAIDNVAEFDGLTVPSGVAPAAAYSVRLLGSALNVPTYTGACMRVRRDSDNVEADIGFDSNNEFGLTSPVSNPSSGGPFTDFADFIGHGGTPANGFVRFWYDQSSNTNDAGQSTAGSQPKIYDSSTGLITENGKPTIDFDGSNDYLVSTSAYPTGTDESHFMTRNAQTGGGRILCTRGTGGAGTVQGWHHKGWSADLCLVDDGAGNSITINDTTANAGQLLRSAFLSQSDVIVFDNGSSFSSNTGSTGSFNSGNNLHIGTNSNGANTQFFNGNMQEMVLYNIDQQYKRFSIENNINGFFGIY